jgi:hypothetical protein
LVVTVSTFAEPILAGIKAREIDVVEGGSEMKGIRIDELG